VRFSGFVLLASAATLNFGRVGRRRFWSNRLGTALLVARARCFVILAQKTSLDKPRRTDKDSRDKWTNEYVRPGSGLAAFAAPAPKFLENSVFPSVLPTGSPLPGGSGMLQARWTILPRRIGGLPTQKRMASKCPRI